MDFLAFRNSTLYFLWLIDINRVVLIAPDAEAKTTVTFSGFCAGGTMENGVVPPEFPPLFSLVQPAAAFVAAGCIKQTIFFIYL